MRENESKQSEYVEGLMKKIYERPDGIKGISDIEDALGHKLYDKWHDDILGYDIMLAVLNNNIVSYVYTSIEPTIEEFSIYAKNSTKVSLFKDLSDILAKNTNPEVVSKCMDHIVTMQSDGAVGLKQFIADMRSNYNLAPQSDYNGDKFYIPLVSIQIKGK